LAGQAPEWTRELPGLLAAHGPVDAATVTERLREHDRQVRS